MPATLARSLSRPALLLAASLTTGCTTTKITNVSRFAPPPAPPSAILVDATFKATGDAKTDEAGRWAATKIGADLIERLRKAGFTAARFDKSAAPGSPALLSVTVGIADKGNRLKRMTIGFGAGRASLGASVRFVPAAAAAPQLGFDGKAWTPFRPGLVIPVGVGLAASGSVGLLPVAANGALGLREGLGRTVVRLDKAIIEQLKRDYYRAGWAWPRKPARTAAAD